MEKRSNLVGKRKALEYLKEELRKRPPKSKKVNKTATVEEKMRIKKEKALQVKNIAGSRRKLKNWKKK